METWRRNLILLTGLLEALLFSGCLFGWPSLLLILQDEGVYQHVCPTNNSANFGNLQDIHSMIGSDMETAPISLPQISKAVPSFPSHSLESHQSFEDSFPGIPQPMRSNCAGKTCDYTSTGNLEKVLKLVKCDEQQIDLTLVYTFAAVLYGITAVFIGMSLEFLGLRVSRVIGSTLACAGFIFLAYTTSERWYFLWPALNLLAVGSNLLRFSGYQFADLWPKYRATILTSYSAGYAISTSFFIAIQLIHEWDIPMRSIFFYCAATCALTYIPTIIMPSEKGAGSKRGSLEEREEGDAMFNPTEEEKNIEMQDLQSNGGKLDETSSWSSASSIESKSPIVKKLSASLKSITSISGILHTYWHFINLYLVFFYSSTFYMWAGKVASSDEDIAFYIKMSGICSLIGPCIAPFTGLGTDWLVNRAKLRSNELERIGYRMQAPTYAMLGATILLTCTIACKLFTAEFAIYVSFVLIAISRPAVVGSCISYIHLRFPEDQFNILNGFFTTFISVLCFVQYPIMKWLARSDEDYIYVHILLLVMLVISAASPIHMMFRKVMLMYARESWMNALRGAR